MENFSKYLAEMIPQEEVSMKRSHQMRKAISGAESDPNRLTITELFEQFRNSNKFIDHFKGNAFVNAFLRAIECSEKQEADFMQANPTCYKYVPFKHLEQGFENCIQMFAWLSKLKIIPVDMPSNFQLKLLGSTVDGLSIPYALHKEDKTHNIPMDVDTMVVLSPPFFPTVTSRRESETSTMGSLLVDGRNCHPGYVKLKIQGQHWLFEIPDVLERDYGGTYLSNTCVQHYIKNMNSSSGPLKEILEKLRVRVHLHGPAATYEMLSSFDDKDDLVIAGDLVASFPWNEFPREANECLSRKRESGWPNMEQIRAVKELGCHFVPVANPGDKDCQTEWRISFALAERHLALSLNQVQRHVYRIIKLIYKHRLERLGVLSTYHLKTTLFWLCERIAQNSWTNEEMGQRFYDFFDLLLEFIRKKCIPNYFIPENNMIDYVDDRFVNDTIDTLRTIRHNPKAILAEIQAKYDIRFDLNHHGYSKRLFQSACRASVEFIVDSPYVLDMLTGAYLRPVDAFSKNDSDNPLRKEDEDSDSVTGAVGGALGAFSKKASDTPLRKEDEDSDSVTGAVGGALGAFSKKDSDNPLRKEVEDSNSVMGAFGEALGAFLKKDSDNPLRKEDEESNSVMGAVGGALRAFSKMDSDTPLIKKLKRSGKLAMEVFCAWLADLADKEDIIEQFGDFAMDFVIYISKLMVNDGLTSAEYQPILELLAKRFKLLKVCDLELKQTPADEHADDQEAALRKRPYPTHDENDGRHNTERESFDLLDEDHIAPSGNKKKGFIELLKDVTVKLLELDLEQTTSDERANDQETPSRKLAPYVNEINPIFELLENPNYLRKELELTLTQILDEHADQEAALRKRPYPTPDENDDHDNAERESFDSLDEDHIASHGNKKKGLIALFGELTAQFFKLDLNLEQTPAEERANDEDAAIREILYLRNDKNDDQHNTKRKSFDSLDEDQIAPSGNKKNRLLGKSAGQLEELDLD